AHADYLEATENLVRLGPTDPSAFGYRGEARAALGDHRGAKADFRRAFEIDPAYAFAGISLFDRQLADNETTEAERTLALLQEHVGGPHILLRTIRMRCLKKDPAGARSAFEELLTTADAPPFVVTKAAATLSEAGYGDVIDDLVRGAIGPDTPGHVARLYVERATGRGDWSFVDQVGGGKTGPEVLYAVVDALAAPAHRSRLHSFIGAHGDRLRETHRGWGKVAVALGAARDFDAVVSWAADWEKRKPDEPWMLHPLAVALRQLGRPEQAHRVCVYASELPGEDTTTPDFRGWMAFEEAVAGRTDRAAELIEDVDAEDLDDVPHILWEFTRGLIDVQRRGRPAFAEARARGLNAIQSLAPKTADPDLLQSYRRWAARLVRDGGGLIAWVWALFGTRRLPKS
ncbi:MAG TPA: hypothetical protein VM597_08615, partial [Gemmataceae bacterium]|nr:hypothetical protein [Gemmataceae bacterium]